jgi:hypothetical protein
MQRCVYGRERDASVKPVEILSGCVTKPSEWQLLGQHMVRMRLSGRKIGLSESFTLEKLKLEENMQKDIFSKS